MKLYLVRHGEAELKEVYTDRPLTERGKKDTEKTARFLKSGGIAIEAIWHSPKQRAKQTAEIMASVLSPQNGLQEKDGLLPEDPVESIVDQIRNVKSDMMIVGHIPFLQKLASMLLLNSGSFEAMKIELGGVVCLESEKSGKWFLIFELIPEIVT